MSSAFDILDRYRDFAGLPIDAWRAFISGDDSAGSALAEPPKNPHEPWLWEDLVGTLPSPPAFREVDRRVLRALGLISVRPHPAAMLRSISQWLGRHLDGEPAGDDWLTLTLQPLALPPVLARQLSLWAGAFGTDTTSTARAVAATPEDELLPILASLLPADFATLWFVARCAPRALASFVHAMHRRHPRMLRGPHLALLAASGHDGPRMQAEGAHAEDLPVLERLLPAGSVPAFAERFALRGAECARSRRLEETAWSTLRAVVLDGAAGVVPSLRGDVVNELLSELSAPALFTDGDRRLLRSIWAANGFTAIGRWVDNAVRFERRGDDAFGAIREALRPASVDDLAISQKLAPHLSCVRGVMGVTSYGRWVLALPDAALRAHVTLHLGHSHWGVGSLELVAREQPGRAEALLDLFAQEKGNANVARATRLLAELLAANPTRFAPFVARMADDPAALYSEQELANPHVEVRVRTTGFELWRLVHAVERPRHAESAKRAAMPLLAEKNSSTGAQALQWLLRTFGSDIRGELEAIVVPALSAHPAAAGGAWSPDAAGVASLLYAFGDRCAPAMAWHLDNPVAYFRLVGLQRLIDVRPDDGRIPSALQGLLDHKDASMVIQAMQLAARWRWDWMVERAWSLLAAKSGRVRFASAKQIALSATAGDWDRAAKLLESKQASARLGAVALLILLDPARSIPLLEVRLDDEGNEEVRDALLIALKDSWTQQGRGATFEDVERRVARARAGKPLAPWLEVAALPPLYSRDGRELPPRTVGWMLARQARVSGIVADLDAEALYPLIDRSRSGEFAMHLLEGFLGAGALAEEGFTLTLVGLLGDDRAVGPLTKAIKHWVSDRRGVFAEYGVHALALGRGRLGSKPS